MKEKSNVLYGIIAFLAAAAAVIPIAVLKLIETAGSHHGHGMAMKMACETTCNVSAVLGAALAAIAVVSIFVKNAKLSIGGCALLVAGGIGVIIVPRVFGLCSAADMACRYLTAPTLSVLGSLIIVLSLARLVLQVISLGKSSVTA
jgi:hypothetical protein